jgi:HAE1 family hydrophobic/amphiphilic exporter-1
MSDTSIRRPIGTLMITLVVIVLGVFGLRNLSIDLLPDITYPLVKIQANYPGVSPEQIEDSITKPIERQVATVDNVEYVSSTSSEGLSLLDVNFKYGTDMDVALQDVMAKIDFTIRDLPTDAERPFAFKADPQQLPIMDYAVSSKKRNLIELREWLEDNLQDQLAKIAGVASVGITGGLTREIQVHIEPERLSAYGLTFDNVVNILNRENLELPGGRVTAGKREYIVRTMGRYPTVKLIEEIVVKATDNGVVYLKDLAQVKDLHEEQRIFTRLNGEPAVDMSIRKQSGANTVKIAKQVEKELARLKNIIPSDIKISLVTNQADYISASIGNVGSTAISGGILAIFVVFFFLASIRRTLIISIAIPISIIATFLMVYLGRLTLNIMSLGGLVLGVGMLVDNAIVVLENISRHQRESEDAIASASAGTREVGLAVSASTLTTLVAFLPFLLITGLAALFFRELILTIAFSITVSLVVALTIVPMLTAQFFKGDSAQKGRLVKLSDRIFSKISAGYRVILRWCISHTWVILPAFIVIFVASLGLVRFLGSEFLPQMDDGRISIRVTTPSGIALEETDKIMRRIESIVATFPVESYLTVTGALVKSSGTTEDPTRSGIDIQLIDMKQRKASTAEIMNQLRGKIAKADIPNAQIKVTRATIKGIHKTGGTSDVDIKLRGLDLTTLSNLARQVVGRIRDIEGLVNVDTTIEYAKPELQIIVDRTRAAQYGLNVSQVAQSIRTAVNGTVATQLIEKDREYDIRVQLSPESIASVQDVENIPLLPASSTAVYVKDVAQVTEAFGPVQITRENQIRQVEVTADVAGRTVGKVVSDIQTALADLNLPEGYFLEHGGEAETMKETTGSLGIVLALAIFLVYVVMAVQFESLLSPLIIMFTLPLSLIGVILGLYLTKTPIGATVGLGVIMLAGIVVNNAIVLVNYIEILRRDQGMECKEAILQAGPVRLRPILMTAFTTIMGLLPLSLGIGEGTETLQPLAVAVIGGLLVSTFLTLLVIPSLYMLFDTVKQKIYSRL